MSITIDGQTYVLTFEDTFTQDTTWQGIGHNGIWANSYRPHLDNGRSIKANNEKQYYVDAGMEGFTSPFTFANGHVTIHASKLSPGQSAKAGGQTHSSGLMTTEMSFSFTYGFIEISADIPDQQGLWSSFWLLPISGEWTSEIDIFEILGGTADTIHTNFWQDDGNGLYSTEYALTGTDAGDGFHTYGLLWTDTTLQWYFDGTLIREATHNISDEMFMLLSLAVGGWAGDTDATTDLGDGLSVDYITVYEAEASSTRNPELQGDFQSHDLKNGSSASETLYGTAFDDVITGEGGNDIIYGRMGDDALFGGQGGDQLFGSDGADTLSGDGDDDKLIGGTGADRLIGGAGKDHMWGGAWSSDGDADTFVFASGSGKDFVHDFETGFDAIALQDYDVNSFDALEFALKDVGWATKVNLASIGGQAGDMIYLIGVDLADIDAGNFVFETQMIA